MLILYTRLSSEMLADLSASPYAFSTSPSGPNLREEGKLGSGQSQARLFGWLLPGPHAKEEARRRVTTVPRVYRFLHCTIKKPGTTAYPGMRSTTRPVARGSTTCSMVNPARIVVLIYVDRVR